MEPQVATKSYYLLRFWRQSDGHTLYAYDHNRGRRYKRSYWHTDNRRAAVEFGMRSEAQSATRSPAWNDLLRPEASGDATKRQNSAYFWEIVEITETLVTSFSEEIVKSDAPAMVVIARAAQ